MEKLYENIQSGGPNIKISFIPGPHGASLGAPGGYEGPNSNVYFHRTK